MTTINRQTSGGIACVDSSENQHPGQKLRVPLKSASVEEVVRVTPILRNLGAEDRARFGRVASARSYARGDIIFREGDAPDGFYTIASGHVKVAKTTPAGKDIILEILGPGDPFGALAVYEGRSFPASATALEETVCVVVPRRAFLDLLEHHPTIVRSLLAGLTLRLVQLASRLAELTGGHVEPRFARLFLKLAAEVGHTQPDGVFVPIRLSRQELADMTGTTIETCIRIMSRWDKHRIVLTKPQGFLLRDRKTLNALALN